MMNDGAYAWLGHVASLFLSPLIKKSASLVLGTPPNAAGHAPVLVRGGRKANKKPEPVLATTTHVPLTPNKAHNKRALAAMRCALSIGTAK